MNPVVCAFGADARVESTFFCHDDWSSKARRLFFFSDSDVSEPGSRVVSTSADEAASWPGLA